MDEQYFVEPIVVETDNLEPPVVASSIFENRKNYYNFIKKPGTPRFSISVLGYNRFNKTKYCIECLLKYTKDIDYELILIDNGSNDETYDFFQSVPHKNKKIIKITKNMATMAGTAVYRIFSGDILVTVSNDVYVTENWLNNLMCCMDSDPSIGLVMPMSSNVSNFQQVDLGYTTMEQMQKKAAQFNKADPLKWEERLRLVSIINVFKRDIIELVGKYDPCFVHDFGEDDFSIRVRRAGYKLVLCGDTFVCHDHDFRKMEDKDPNAYMKSLSDGRVTYKQKYNGIDAWDDITNIEVYFLQLLKNIKFSNKAMSTLVIDGRCGSPVLSLSNSLRKQGIANESRKAFTTQAKYYADLQTVASCVDCDRIDFIQDYYVNSSLDIALLGKPINLYTSPILLLQKIFDFLKPGGVLLFKLRNTNTVHSLLKALNMGGNSDDDMPAQVSVEAICECLKIFGSANIDYITQAGNYSDADKEYVSDIITKATGDCSKDLLNELFVTDYHFCVIKK